MYCTESKFRHTNVDLGSKRLLGRGDPITEYGGGGFKLKVQGMDSNPVNKCIPYHLSTGDFMNKVPSATCVY